MKKKIIFTLVMMGILYLCMELFSFVVIKISAKRLYEPVRSKRSIYEEQTRLIEQLLKPGYREMFDPLLGWKYRPGFSRDSDVINRQGLRSRRAYTKQPAKGALRIAAFGDSFTYCNEVGNDDSWPAQMEREFSCMEVLNYGVGGYGTDQAYLRYQHEGRKLNPNVVIIGFAPTDLRRTVNVYRRFYSSLEIPLFKPRYVFDESGGGFS